MTTRELENLARIGQLKTEPRNEAEFKRLLKMARTRLADAQLDRVSRKKFGRVRGIFGGGGVHDQGIVWIGGTVGGYCARHGPTALSRQ